MNAAAHELGKLAGEIAHQRSREPVLAKARAMRDAFGLPPAAALCPPLLLSLGDRA